MQSLSWFFHRLWRVSRGQIVAVAVVATDRRGALLLMETREKGGARTWTLPTVAIAPGETARDAARKALEIVGATAGLPDLRALDVPAVGPERADRAILFRVTDVELTDAKVADAESNNVDVNVIDGRAVRLFTRDNLPPLAAGVREAIALAAGPPAA